MEFKMAKSNRLFSLLFMLIFVFIFIAMSACKTSSSDDDGPTDSTTDTAGTPSVVSVSPADGSTDVSANITIVVTFSEAMKPSSFGTLGDDDYTNRHYRIGAGGVEIGAHTAKLGNGEKELQITPASNLDGNTEYMVIVDKAVLDYGNNEMDADFESTFTTAASDSIAPSVVSITPADGSSGVNTGTDIVIMFNEAMDESSLDLTNASTANNSIVYVYHWDGSANYVSLTATLDASKTKLTLNPNSALNGAATTYYVRINDAAKDLAGNNLPQFNASFVTQ
jgi:methionine-rich copper-binding protein CopC